MRRKLIIIIVAVAVIVIAALAYLGTRGPDLSAYEKFREPALLKMPALKVVVVEATGKPESVAEDAFKLLFSVYFKLDGVPKGPAMPAPRTRWPSSEETPMEQWVGRYAIPVPDSVTALPQVEAKAGLTPKLDDWSYGEVAQILHVGPYQNDGPAIQRLHTFIASQGYEVAGDMEEEYLRGPNIFGKGNPEKYYTLIRYPVRPAAK